MEMPVLVKLDNYSGARDLGNSWSVGGRTCADVHEFSSGN